MLYRVVMQSNGSETMFVNRFLQTRSIRESGFESRYSHTLTLERFKMWPPPLHCLDRRGFGCLSERMNEGKKERRNEADVRPEERVPKERKVYPAKFLTRATW